MVSLTVNAATNRILTYGFSYDAAGNLVQWPGGTVTIGAEYDVDGRITWIGYDWGGGARHYYNARNQRVRTETRLQVYGLGGELLGEYERVQGQWAPGMVRERIYFAGQLVGMVEGDGSWSLPGTDRLGSLKQGSRRYPFGDGNESYANDEYATYRKDHGSAHYYAWNRYYSATWGRFSSPDPYVMSGGLTNPQGWNRYSYVANDPVNFTDSTGLQRDVCGDDEMENDPYCVYKRGGSGRWAMGMGSYWNGEYWSDFWAPIWIPNPSPGGGGTRSTLELHNLLNTRLRAQTAEAIRNLSQKCKTALAEAGVDLGAVAVIAASTTYYSIEFEGHYQVRDISGYVNPLHPNQNLKQYLGSARAATLPNAAGTGAANYVVIGPAFFTQTILGSDLVTSQNRTLIHEALHTGTGLNDVDLAIRLGLGKLAQSVASVAISSWLAY